MKFTIYETFGKASEAMALEIADIVKNKHNALLCLAAGHTSLKIFDEMVKLQHEGYVNFKTAFIVGLDEWTGMSRDDDGSCAGFLYKNIFDRLEMPESHIRLFNGMYQNPEIECAQVEKFIADHGGIDYMLLGIGMNGHLGLNEPGTDFNLGAHVTEIAETTKSVGQKYFKSPTSLNKGITLGVKNILESKRIVLAADASRKSTIIHELYITNPDPILPATALKLAANCEVVLDLHAAEKIKEFIHT